MSQNTAQPAQSQPPATRIAPMRWRDVWQLPTTAAGLLVLVAGLIYAVKTAPRVDHGGALIEAAAQIEESKYAEALGTLNAKVLPHMGGEALTNDQQRNFFLLRARAIYLGQHELGISRKENYQNILSEYRAATEHGAKLTPKDLAYRCFTLIELGEMERAVEEMEALPIEEDGMDDLRLTIHKRLIDAAINGRPPRYDAALELITRLSRQPDLASVERVWVLERQSKLLVLQGFAEEAISRILRAMPRVESADPRSLGRVVATLAEAYLAVDDPAKAGEQLTRAAQLLGKSDDLSPRIVRLLGYVDQIAGGERITGARERYTRVLETWPYSPEAVEAVLGLAEVESVIANAEAPQLLQDSLRHYGELVDALRGETPPVAMAAPSMDGPAAAHTTDGHGEATHTPTGAAGDAPPDGIPATPQRHRNDPQTAAVANAIGSLDDHGSLPSRTLRSIMSRFVEQFDKRDYDSALKFAHLGQRLTGIDAAPADLLLGTARTHREIAADLLGRRSGEEAEKEGHSAHTALTLAQADPATQREAREHLLKAGEFYRIHAGTVVQADARAYGDSLWAAADMFDRAGDLAGSAAAFGQFATDFPADSRKPEAIFRMAEADRARGDLEQASKLYRGLIAGRGDSRDSGPFADASYVPFARTLLLDAKPENDAEAEELLLSVVRGGIGGTGTPMFRDALKALGEHYYDVGQNERAIERLNEYLERTRLDTPPSPTPTLTPPTEVASVRDIADTHATSLSSNSAATAPAVGRGSAADESPTAETLGLRYKLADAYRLSAAGITAGFAAAMPDSQRRELEHSHRDRLEQAMGLFDDVQRGYEKRAKRSALDALRLRNAYFYQADCAFELRDYDAAIRLYDTAKERYPKDAASLVAMVQIVAALLEQGKTAEAVTANLRAKRFYESLPDAAWDDPALPMNRKQWESWLDSQTRLAGAATEPGDQTKEAPR